MAARILVVDDSTTIRKVVGAILELHGYDVVAAVDGQAALELLTGEAKEVVDLVLLDFVMPRMNGYQFCRAARKDDTLAALPIVLMSAKSDKIRDQFVQQTGAIDAISKPFDAQALVAVIENALRRVSSGRASAARLPEVDVEEPSDSAGTVPPADGTPTVALAGDLSVVPIGAVLQLLQVEGQSGVLTVSNERSEIVVTMRGGLIDLVQSRGTNDEFRLGRYFVEEGLVTPEDLAELLVAGAPANDASPPMSGHFETRPPSAAAETLPRIPDAPESRPADKEPETTRLEPQEAEEIRRRAEAQAIDVDVVPGDMTVPEGVPEAAPRLLGDRLLAAGRVNEEQLKAALLRQSSELVYEMLRWPRGRFEFTRRPPPALAATARLGLTVPAVVMEGFRRVDEWRGLERTIGSFEGIIVRDELALAQVPKDKMTKAETLVLGAIDGQRTIREVVAASHMSSFDACRVLVELLEARVVRRL